MASSLRSVFPDQVAPAFFEGLVALSEPVRLEEEMQRSGLVDVTVVETQGVWQGPDGDDYLNEMREFHTYMPRYAKLGPTTDAASTTRSGR